MRLDPLAIDWQGYNEHNFPFTLRQLPGEKNSLGRIKFHMSNPYAVFLHGTPAKALFEQPVRAFSSGCVRVEEVDELARRLLLNGGQSPLETLERPLQDRQTHIQKLNRPIPVYLVYFTAWVDETGVVHFRPDIYRRNQALLQAFRSETETRTASHSRDPDSAL
jgi:murein L,D-transpeptidase YcbB/YkuD